MRCETEKLSLPGLLAGHFAPSPHEDLVVTRAEFPHWMRPDLQRAIETLVAELPKHRFVGLRLRERERELHFGDLAEEKSKAVAIGPAVFQDIDIGEAEPVRCATRALWLAERDGVPFALLVDVEEGYHRVRARVEIAARPDEKSRKVASRVGEELRAGAALARCWRGKRGGARVIYYRHVPGERIYLIYAYAKNVKDDLTREQVKVLANLMKDIVDG